MKTELLDVVIPLKRAAEYEELRYMLRSICQNMPHRNVVLVGHKPSWAVNVVHVPTSTMPRTLSRFVRIAQSIAEACADERISENFVRFDDDFFVVKPVSDIQPMYRGNLDDIIAHYQKLPPEYQSYLDGLYRTRDALRVIGVKGDLLNYELHVPMVFNKAALAYIDGLKHAVHASADVIHQRTLYGNYYAVGGAESEDAKLFKLDDDPSEKYPDAAFVSTSNVSFVNGKAGQYLRDLFSEPCKYEAAP